MKGRTFWLLAILVLFLVMASLETSLAVVDRTATVGASATMGAVSSLTVQAKNIINNYDVLAVTFGSISQLTNKLAPQYVLITVRSNILGTGGAWGLEIYTNNFTSAPNTSVWGYQYGGLKGATVGHRVPLVWQAYTTTRAVSDPPANLSGWTYAKDKWDLDMPGTTDNESWATAHADGYTNVAYGGIDYLMVIEPGTGLTGGVKDTDDTLAIYLGGLFGSAAADTYSTTIYFDLYHE